MTEIPYPIRAVLCLIRPIADGWIKKEGGKPLVEGAFRPVNRGIGQGNPWRQERFWVTSLRGGAPNWRLYSLLNWEPLS